MEQATEAPLKKTPLNARHRASGAKMVPFGGWDMPVEYAGIGQEHAAVRTRAGLFDVSHMGEIEIAGKDALAAVQRIASNDASRLAVGQAQYSGLMTPNGAFVDDLLVYRLAADHFLLVVNAGNIEKDYAWIAEHIKPAGDASVRQRYRRDDDGARGGSRVDRRLEKRGLHRRGRSSRAESRRRPPQDCRIRTARARNRAARLRGVHAPRRRRGRPCRWY